MKYYRPVLLIGAIEILIGSVTIVFNLITLGLSQNNKSFSVLCFVLAAGGMSTLIGIGILKLKTLAYQSLLYFSSVIILSKLLIYLDVIQLNGALETTVPGPVKNILSIIYHGSVIAYLCKPDIKRMFHS